MANLLAVATRRSRWVLGFFAFLGNMPFLTAYCEYSSGIERRIHCLPAITARSAATGIVGAVFREMADYEL